MTVSDYKYYYDYLLGLEEYYNKYVKVHSLSENIKLNKEINNIRLKLNKSEGIKC